MKASFIIINEKLCYRFPYSPEFSWHHLLSTCANRLLHSRGDVYCHQQSKQSSTLVAEESIGEREVAWSTVKAAQGPDTDTLCALTECAKMQQNNVYVFIFSHWQSLFNNTVCVLSNSWAGAITSYCHTVTGTFPMKLGLSETAAESCTPWTGLSFWNTKFLCSRRFFVSRTIKQCLEQPYLWLHYYSLATLGGALQNLLSS